MATPYQASRDRGNLEADQHGNDTTEETTGKDILIPGDARNIKVQFYAAMMMDGKRVGGSLPRDPKHLLFKVQIKPYDNYRSHLLLRGSAVKPHDRNGKPVQGFSVHLKIPVRRMVMHQSRDQNSNQKDAMQLDVVKDLGEEAKSKLGVYFPDVNPEEDNQWILSFEATGYTAINLFSDETLNSSEATADLALLRETLESAQLHKFDILVSSFSGLSFPQDIETLNEKAREEDEYGDPLRLFYPNHPNKVFIQIGDVPTPEERPEIENRNAVAAFDDFAEYVTNQGYGAIYEGEYVKKAAQAYYDEVFYLRAFELPGTNCRRYYAFIDFTSIPDLIKPKVGENIKVNLNPDVNASDEDWSGTVVEPFPFIPAGNLTIELRRRRLDLPDGSTELNRPFCNTPLAAGTGKYRNWAEASQAFMTLSVTRVVIRVPFSNKTLRGEINSLRKLTDGEDPHHQFWREYLVGQDIRAKTTFDVLNEIKPGAPQPTYTEAQAKAREGLRATPNGIHLVQGPPGTGKTFYYTNLLSELLHDNDIKVVVVTPSNNAADDAARGIAKLFSNIPSLKGKVIGRVHSLASEHNAMLDSAGRPKPVGVEDVVDREQLESECAGFAAAMYLQEIYAQSEDVKKYGDKRRVLVDLSVAYHAIRNMHKDPARYATLHELYAKFQKGEAMEKDELAQLRALVTEVEQDTLRGLDVAVLTLANVGNESFWKVMEDVVKIVVVDEGARATEMSLINALANLKPKLLIDVGDWRQMRPTVLSGDHRDAKVNPFGNQISLTFLERMRRLGVPTYMLDEQLRMLEHIARHPSNASYDGKLRTHPSVTIQSRPAAVKFRQFILSEFKVKTNRLIINVPDSQASRDINSRSMFNLGHIEVAMVILNKMKTKGLFQHGHLTLLTFYQDEYDALNAIINGTALKNVIDVRKVDGFQGGEDCFIMLLFAGTETPGFMSDLRRLNVALTRGRNGLICIMNIKMIKEVRGHEAMFALINDAKRCHDLVEITSHNLTGYRNVRPAMPQGEPNVVNPGGAYAAAMTGRDPYESDKDVKDAEGAEDADGNNGIDDYRTDHTNKKARHTRPKQDTEHVKMVDSVEQKVERHQMELEERMSITQPHMWTKEMIELRSQQEALAEQIALVEKMNATVPHMWTSKMVQARDQQEKNGKFGRKSSREGVGNHHGKRDVAIQLKGQAEEVERNILLELKRTTPPHMWTKEMVDAEDNGCKKRRQDQMSGK